LLGLALQVAMSVLIALIIAWSAHRGAGAAARDAQPA
jgi:hypothetical protein